MFVLRRVKSYKRHGCEVALLRKNNAQVTIKILYKLFHHTKTVYSTVVNNFPFLLNAHMMIAGVNLDFECRSRIAEKRPRIRASV